MFQKNNVLKTRYKGIFFAHAIRVFVLFLFYPYSVFLRYIDRFQREIKDKNCYKGEIKAKSCYQGEIKTKYRFQGEIKSKNLLSRGN